jgi:hypothetical protein
MQTKRIQLNPPWQIDKLEGVLTKVQHHKSLGHTRRQPTGMEKKSSKKQEKGQKDRPSKNHNSRRNTYGIGAIP